MFHDITLTSVLWAGQVIIQALLGAARTSHTLTLPSTEHEANTCNNQHTLTIIMTVPYADPAIVKTVWARKLPEMTTACNNYHKLVFKTCKSKDHGQYIKSPTKTIARIGRGKHQKVTNSLTIYVHVVFYVVTRFRPLSLSGDDLKPTLKQSYKNGRIF